MVSFASKAGTGIRSDLKASSGGGQWLRGFKDGKDCRVRFLQDPEEWLKYKEHYSQATKFFPCTQDRDCPGCTSDDERMKKPSRRYIAQALIVQEQDAQDEGRVVALKLPVDLANRLVNKADRNNGTLLDRDYTIVRTGAGLDTEYDVEVEDRSKVDTSKYDFVDTEAILNDMYESAWGKPEPHATATVVKDDPAPFETASQDEAVEAGPVTVAPVEEVVITEEHLRSLDKQALLKLLRDNSVTVPTEIQLKATSVIVDWVVENLAD